MAIGLLAGGLVSISLGAFVRTPLFTRWRSAVLVVALVAAVVALTRFVLGENRWTRYSGGAHGLYWATVAVAAIAVVLLLLAAARGRPRLGRIGTVVAGLACACLLVTASGFSVN